MVYDLWGKKRLGLISRETEPFSVIVIRIKDASSDDRALAARVRRCGAVGKSARRCLHVHPFPGRYLNG